MDGIEDVIWHEYLQYFLIYSANVWTNAFFLSAATTAAAAA